MEKDTEDDELNDKTPLKTKIGEGMFAHRVTAEDPETQKEANSSPLLDELCALTRFAASDSAVGIMRASNQRSI